MKSRFKAILRITAAVISIAFLANDFAYAAPSLGSLLPRTIIQDPSLLKLPESIAKIQGWHQGNANRLIIHIQDAHTNLSAQENLSKTLEELITRYQLKTVFVEGGTQDDSLGFLRPLAPLSVRQRVAKKYLIKGELNGAEYLDLTSDYSIQLQGVEEAALYRENLKTYAAIAGKREPVLAYLDEIQKRVQSLKRQFYSKELFAFDDFLEKFEKKEKDYTEYYALLTSEAGKTHLSLLGYPNFFSLKNLKSKEEQIDFNKANEEQMALVLSLREAQRRSNLTDESEIASPLARNDIAKLKSQDPCALGLYETLFEKAKAAHVDLAAFPNLLKYADYLSSYAAVNMGDLLKESKAIEESIYQSSLQSEEDRYLYEIADHLKTLRSLFSLQISKENFERYAARQKDVRFETIVYLAFLNKKLYDLGNAADVVRYLPLIDENKTEVELFYKTTEARDEIFVEKSLKHMQKNDLQIAVLLTGGYHTPHLKELLKKQGVSYIVVTPNVEQETNQKRYEELLLNQLNAKSEIASVKAETQNATLNLMSAAERPFTIRAVAGELQSAIPVLGARLSKNKFRSTETWTRSLILAVAVYFSGIFTAAAQKVELVLDQTIKAMTFSVNGKNLTKQQQFGVVYQPTEDDKHISYYTGGHMDELIAALLPPGDPIFDDPDVKARIPASRAKNDIKLLQEKGINNIRLYYAPIPVIKDGQVVNEKEIIAFKKIMDRAYELSGNNLRMLVGHWGGEWGLPGSPKLERGTPENRKVVIDSLVKMVETYGKKPWVLSWMIFNEANLRATDGAMRDPHFPLETSELYQLVVDAAIQMKLKEKEMGTKHPIFVGNGSLTSEEAYWLSVLNEPQDTLNGEKPVDGFGLNLYPGMIPGNGHFSWRFNGNTSEINTVLRLAAEAGLNVIFSEIGTPERVDGANTQEPFFKAVGLAIKGSTNLVMTFAHEWTDEKWKGSGYEGLFGLKSWLRAGGFNIYFNPSTPTNSTSTIVNTNIPPTNVPAGVDFSTFSAESLKGDSGRIDLTTIQYLKIQFPVSLKGVNFRLRLLPLTASSGSPIGILPNKIMIPQNGTVIIAIPPTRFIRQIDILSPAITPAALKETTIEGLKPSGARLADIAKTVFLSFAIFFSGALRIIADTVRFAFDRDRTSVTVLVNGRPQPQSRLMGANYQPTKPGRHITYYSEGRVRELVAQLLPKNDPVLKELGLENLGENDLERMNKAGIFNIHLYQVPLENKEDIEAVKKILRRAHQLNKDFYVSVGHWAGLWSQPGSPELSENTPEGRLKVAQSVMTMVKLYAQEPWMGKWVIGVENNYYAKGGAFAGTKSLPLRVGSEYYDFMTQLAVAIKWQERQLNTDTKPVYHPVVLGNGSLTTAQAQSIREMNQKWAAELDGELPIDAIGGTFYPGVDFAGEKVSANGISEAFEHFVQLSWETAGLPLVVLETGPWARTVDSDEQVRWYKAAQPAFVNIRKFAGIDIFEFKNEGGWKSRETGRRSEDWFGLYREDGAPKLFARQGAFSAWKWQDGQVQPFVPPTVLKPFLKSPSFLVKQADRPQAPVADNSIITIQGFQRWSGGGSYSTYKDTRVDLTGYKTVRLYFDPSDADAEFDIRFLHPDDDYNSNAGLARSFRVPKASDPSKSIVMEIGIPSSTGKIKQFSIHTGDSWGKQHPTKRNLTPIKVEFLKTPPAKKPGGARLTMNRRAFLSRTAALAGLVALTGANVLADEAQEKAKQEVRVAVAGYLKRIKTENGISDREMVFEAYFDVEGKLATVPKADAQNKGSAAERVHNLEAELAPIFAGLKKQSGVLPALIKNAPEAVKDVLILLWVYDEAAFKILEQAKIPVRFGDTTFTWVEKLIPDGRYRAEEITIHRQFQSSPILAAALLIGAVRGERPALIAYYQKELAESTQKLSYLGQVAFFNELKIKYGFNDKGAITKTLEKNPWIVAAIGTGLVGIAAAIISYYLFWPKTRPSRRSTRDDSTDAPDRRGPGGARLAIHPTPEPAPPKELKTILIVDDESMMVVMAQAMLSRQPGFENMRILTATSGLDALRKIKDGSDAEGNFYLDLVISDLQMPGMSGQELIAKLRGEFGYGSSVLYMSGYLDPGDLTNGDAKTGFIQKPFDASEIVAEIKKLLLASNPVAAPAPAAPLPSPATLGASNSKVLVNGQSIHVRKALLRTFQHLLNNKFSALTLAQELLSAELSSIPNSNIFESIKFEIGQIQEISGWFSDYNSGVRIYFYPKTEEFIFEYAVVGNGPIVWKWMKGFENISASDLVLIEGDNLNLLKQEASFSEVRQQLDALVSRSLPLIQQAQHIASLPPDTTVEAKATLRRELEAVKGALKQFMENYDQPQAAPPAGARLALNESKGLADSSWDRKTQERFNAAFNEFADALKLTHMKLIQNLKLRWSELTIQEASRELSRAIDDWQKVDAEAKRNPALLRLKIEFNALANSTITQNREIRTRRKLTNDKNFEKVFEAMLPFLLRLDFRELTELLAQASIAYQDKRYPDTLSALNDAGKILEAGLSTKRSMADSPAEFDRALKETLAAVKIMEGITLADNQINNVRVAGATRLDPRSDEEAAREWKVQKAFASYQLGIQTGLSFSGQTRLELAQALKARYPDEISQAAKRLTTLIRTAAQLGFKLPSIESQNLRSMLERNYPGYRLTDLWLNLPQPAVIAVGARLASVDQVTLLNGAIESRKVVQNLFGILESLLERNHPVFIDLLNLARNSQPLSPSSIAPLRALSLVDQEGSIEPDVRNVLLSSYPQGEPQLPKLPWPIQGEQRPANFAGARLTLASQTSASPAETPLKILLVDQASIIRERLTELITQNNPQHEVTEAEAPAAAIQKILEAAGSESSYRLVFVEKNVARQLIAAIQNLTAPLTIVVMSANSADAKSFAAAFSEEFSGVKNFTIISYEKLTALDSIIETARQAAGVRLGAGLPSPENGARLASFLEKPPKSFREVRPNFESASANEARVGEISSGIARAVRPTLSPAVPVTFAFAGEGPILVAPVFASTFVLQPGSGDLDVFTQRFDFGSRTLVPSDGGKSTISREKLQGGFAPIKNLPETFSLPQGRFAEDASSRFLSGVRDRILTLSEGETGVVAVDAQSFFDGSGDLRARDLAKVLQILNTALAYDSLRGRNIQIAFYGPKSGSEEARLALDGLNRLFSGAIRLNYLVVEAESIQKAGGVTPAVKEAEAVLNGAGHSRFLAHVFSNTNLSVLSPDAGTAYLGMDAETQTSTSLVSATPILVALSLGANPDLKGLPMELKDYAFRTVTLTVGGRKFLIPIMRVMPYNVDAQVFLATLSRRSTSSSA